MAPEARVGPGDPALLACRLGSFSITLLVLYAARVAAAFFPFRPLETIWQLSAVSALLESAALPLLGLGLLHLAAYLDPDNQRLSRGRDRLARWAILASIGFLLLLPLQAFASWSSVAAAQSRVVELRTATHRNFTLLRDAINGATSPADLQRRLRSLESRELAIRFDDLGLPLPDTQRQLLTRLNALEEQVTVRINPPPGEAIEDVARNSLRVMATSLVYALAFAMTAQRRGQQVPLLVELMALWSLSRDRRRTPALDTGAFADLGAATAAEEDEREPLPPPAAELPGQAGKPGGSA